jgi:hypothetical protein
MATLKSFPKDTTIIDYILQDDAAPFQNPRWL